MNTIVPSTTLLLFGGALQSSFANELVLSEHMMRLTKQAAELSKLAFDTDPAIPESGWDYLESYQAEPEHALFAMKDGYCYAAFRGTTPTFEDWMYNFRIANKEVCVDLGSGKEECCTVHNGFWQAYNAVYRDKFEASLRKCAAGCMFKDECVVITGHSQGAAMAAVAALQLADLNPYVITFGQPSTIDAPCNLVTSDRWYRYVNTKASEMLFGLVYDPVPFVNRLAADDFGHMILLSEDNTGVAYIGLDSQDYFGPPNVKGFQAHNLRMRGTGYPGYLDRIDSIMRMYDSGMLKYPVRTSGYADGSLCTQDNECESRNCVAGTPFSYSRCVSEQCRNDSDCPNNNRCDFGLCIPKAGSCELCNEHSDCQSGVCSWKFRCTGAGGLMDDNCYCNFNGDCWSDRCEGNFPLAVCEPKLSNGATCNEDSDCHSGHCSWAFRCANQWWRQRMLQESEELLPNNTSDAGTGIKWFVSVACLVGAATITLLVILGASWFRQRQLGYEMMYVRLTL